MFVDEPTILESIVGQSQHSCEGVELVAEQSILALWLDIVSLAPNLSRILDELSIPEQLVGESEWLQSEDAIVVEPLDELATAELLAGVSMSPGGVDKKSFEFDGNAKVAG